MQLNTFTETLVCEAYEKIHLHVGSIHVGSSAACTALLSRRAVTYSLPHNYNQFCFSYYKAAMSY